MIDQEKIEIVVAGEEHIEYVDEILDTITRAAKVQIGRASCRERV